MTRHLFKSAIIIYALLLTFCNSEKTSYEQAAASSDNIKETLVEKYNGILFEDINNISSQKSLVKLFKSTAILDSVIIAATKTRYGYYFKAIIQNNINTKVYAELTCTKELYEKYKASKCTAFLMAVDISKVDKINVSAEFDTIKEDSLLINVGEELFIAGKCKEIIEDPRQKNLLS